MTRRCLPQCTGNYGCEGIIYLAIGGMGWYDVRIKPGFTHNRGTLAERRSFYAKHQMHIVWFADRDDMGHPLTWDIEQSIHEQIRQQQRPYAGREWYEMDTHVLRVITRQLIDIAAPQLVTDDIRATLTQIFANSVEADYQRIHDARDTPTG